MQVAVGLGAWYDEPEGWAPTPETQAIHCEAGDVGALRSTTVMVSGRRKPMPLKSCRECGQDVSTEATACPHCGVPEPMKEQSGDRVPCPKCGNSNTHRIGPGSLGCVSFGAGGCMLWIPVIGWVLAPILFLLALGLWISALFRSGTASFQCKACKGWFTVPKAQLPKSV